MATEISKFLGFRKAAWIAESLVIKEMDIIPAILYFRKSHNTSCLPPEILHNDCIRFLLGHEHDPREIENNAYANVWEGKTGVLWDLRKWRIQSFSYR